MKAALFSLAMMGQLLGDQADRLFRDHAPQIEDNPEISFLLQDPRTVYYSERAIDRPAQGLGFPLGDPAGLHASENWRKIRFFRLPQGRKIAWYLAGQYGWVFPVGSHVGEILYVHHSDDKDYPFEVRVRTREYGKWSVDVLRPYLDLDELSEMIPEMEMDFDVAPVKQHRLAASGIDSTARMAWLPRIEPHRARKVLSQPFKSIAGVPWDVRGGETVDGVTTSFPDSVVPQFYTGAHFEVEREECMQCHNRHPEWDNILSFSPWLNGNQGQVRSSLTPYVERYNQARHPERIYHLSK